MKEYKVGFAGLKRGASYAHIFEGNPKTEITALCDTNEANLAAGGEDFGLKDSQLFNNYDDFINADFDIAVIGSPIPSHAEQVVKALKNKKHVLSEVTASNTVEGCRQIVDAVRNSDRKYMLAENCIYMHFVKKWKEVARSGKIGKVIYAEAEYVHHIPQLIVDPDTKKKKWRAERPPIYYCTHSLGPILYILDDHIVRCTCMGKSENIMPNVGVGAIDYQIALFETSNGAVIKVLRSQVLPRIPALGHYQLHGTKGFIENGRRGYASEGSSYFEGEDEAAKPMDCSYSDPNAPEAAKLGGHGSSEYYLVRDFLESIESNITPSIDVVKAMDITIPGIIAHEAAVKGNVWLDVPRLTD